MLVVVGESEEDRQHEEVAADDDVRFVTLCDGHCHDDDDVCHDEDCPDDDALCNPL